MDRRLHQSQLIIVSVRVERRTITEKMQSDQNKNGICITSQKRRTLQNRRGTCHRCRAHQGEQHHRRFRMRRRVQRPPLRSQAAGCLLRVRHRNPTPRRTAYEAALRHHDAARGDHENAGARPHHADLVYALSKHGASNGYTR